MNIKHLKMVFVVFVSVVLLTLTVGSVSAGLIVDFSADKGVVTAGNVVTMWKDQSDNGFNALPPDSSGGPLLTFTPLINGRSHPVLRFDGRTMFLTASPHVPVKGTLFLVFSNNKHAGDSRVIGWEDSAVGDHGLGIAPDIQGLGLDLIARNEAAIGDILSPPGVNDIEVVTASWGVDGMTLERRLANGGIFTSSNTAIASVSDGGYGLHLGAPGDYDNTFTGLFEGDIAVFRVYNEQLTAPERAVIANSLYIQWVAGFTGPDCHGGSISELARQFGGIKKAASALGFPNVAALQDAIQEFCKG